MKVKHLPLIILAFISLSAFSQSMTDSLVTYLNFDTGEAVDLSPRQVGYKFVTGGDGSYDFEDGFNGGKALRLKPGPVNNPAFLKSTEDSIIDILSPTGATIAMRVTMDVAIVRQSRFLVSGNTHSFLYNEAHTTARRLNSQKGDRLPNALFNFNETDTILPGDVWNHLAITFEHTPGAGGEAEDSITVKIYTHGKYVKGATLEKSRIFPSLLDTIVIGGRFLTNQHQSQTGWLGKINEVAIYNRALSIEEIGYLKADTLRTIYASVDVEKIKADIGSQVDIYSNNNMVKIFNRSDIPIQVDFYDITGRQVNSIDHINQNYEFYIQKPGIYIARVRSGMNIISVRKLIIM